MKIETNRMKPQVEFGFYIAALFDLVGQRDHIRGLETLPNSDAERTEFVSAVRNSVGVVHAFRDSFIGFFEKYTAKPSPLPSHNHPWYSAVKAEYERDELFGISCQTFGDTVVLYSRLVGEDARVRWHTIYGFVVSAAYLLPYFLAQGHPFRGGVDVAVGVEAYENELYGPVLRNVYELEQTADYCRILVGNGLLDLISGTAFRGVRYQSEPRHAIQVAHATVSSMYIGTDLDNRHIIDYAEASVAEEVDISVPARMRPLLPSVERTARRQLKDARERGNMKVAGKIERLLEYLVSRRPASLE